MNVVYRLDLHKNEKIDSSLIRKDIGISSKNNQETLLNVYVKELKI